jgi:hypothetical protein
VAKSSRSSLHSFKYRPRDHQLEKGNQSQASNFLWPRPQLLHSIAPFLLRAVETTKGIRALLAIAGPCGNLSTRTVEYVVMCSAPVGAGHPTGTRGALLHLNPPLLAINHHSVSSSGRVDSAESGGMRLPGASIPNFGACGQGIRRYTKRIPFAHIGVRQERQHQGSGRENSPSSPAPPTNSPALSSLSVMSHDL